nr:MAG TPA: peptidase [Caudoviricetes sp.]
MKDMISENFSYHEFEDSVKAKENNIDNSIPGPEVKEHIRALVLHVLQPIRDALQKPLVVNSGYRCPELNELVGGKPTSQHLKGEAADIHTSSPYALAKLAKELELPFDQMILYPTFVHFSHKLDGEQRGYIGYSKTYNGDKL